MKVNDFYPVFYTDDIETETKRYTENLGFTVVHKPKIENLDYVVLENDKKRRIDLVCSHFPSDSFKDGFLGMRANVDDFFEAVSWFESIGYSLFGSAHETETSITALLVKNNKEHIIVFKHK
ncbi:hypothetical protein J6Y73_05180 [bacterium]|nr:hypothetical protein [bacterium]